jgi:hypothetical protein
LTDQIKSNWSSTSKSTKVGIGVRHGAEAVVHSLQTLVASKGSDSSLACLSVDFANAFNQVDRHTFLTMVREHFPAAAAWVEATYVPPGHLWFGSAEFDSRTGVQQGDPLGPLLFALVLSKMTSRIVERVPDLLFHVWYLDDGSIVGTRSQLAQVLLLLETEGPGFGLHLQPQKCSLWWPSLDGEAFASLGVPLLEADGLRVLGGPVGSAAFADRLLRERVAKINSLLLELDKLDDPQIELALLRSCAGLPKLAFALRCAPPEAIAGAISVFQSCVDRVLDSILGTFDIPSSARTLFHLKPSRGGLGVPLASLTG